MSRWGRIPSLYREHWEIDQSEKEERERTLRPFVDQLERHPVADDRNWDEALYNDDKDTK